MISEIRLMQYADGTLSPEEKKKIDKEIKNNPKHLKTIKDFKKTREFLLDVNEAIRAKPLSNTLKLKLKKIKQIEKRRAFSFAKLLEHTYTKIIAGIAVLGVIIFALFKSAKGWTIGMMLKYWPIFIESILSFFRKSIEFIKDLIPVGKQVAEIFNDLMPLLT